MTDRELLTLAARAVGITGTYVVNAPIDGQFRTGIWNDLLEEIWNPLRFPGDALRLAVQLHIELKFQAPDYRPHWTVLAFERGDWAAATETGPDPLAATMRAITRAAAEIGRRIQDGNRND